MDTLKNITNRIVAFRDERDWAQFHTPRNLAAALSIEASELQETLLWKSDTEVHNFIQETKGRSVLSEEIADVLTFALLFCHAIGIDPVKALEHKLGVNAAKYPVERAKGNAKKYMEL